MRSDQLSSGICGHAEVAKNNDVFCRGQTIRHLMGKERNLPEKPIGIQFRSIGHFIRLPKEVPFRNRVFFFRPKILT